MRESVECPYARATGYESPSIVPARRRRETSRPRVPAAILGTQCKVACIEETKKEPHDKPATFGLHDPNKIQQPARLGLSPVPFTSQLMGPFSRRTHVKRCKVASQPTPNLVFTTRRTTFHCIDSPRKSLIRKYTIHRRNTTSLFVLAATVRGLDTGPVHGLIAHHKREDFRMTTILGLRCRSEVQNTW